MECSIPDTAPVTTIKDIYYVKYHGYSTPEGYYKPLSWTADIFLQ